MKVLCTGVSGFLGRRLSEVLLAHTDLQLISLVRGKVGPEDSSTLSFLGPIESVDLGLGRVRPDCIVHCAGLAHVSLNNNFPSYEEFRRVNSEFTVNLGKQAALVGVKRFIFISSIGVNGNSNTKPFSEADTTKPADLYAHSKWEAEQRLWEIQRETGMELVIIRPPLVYGPNAPGNFGYLMRWVKKGIPLPLGAIHNQRSLVALDNLVDLIITCLDHRAAANQVFLAGDGQDMSTTELLRGVARAMGKPARLLPVPSSLLMLGATLLGKKAVAQRLLGSLQVDISKARSLLGWEPPISVEEGLRRCFQPKDN